MSVHRFLTALLRNPKHLVGHRNIFLFSHMRAYTSRFGHILGSHPQIEGYYQMQIGYYSWKSLWRQKLLYLGPHDVKPASGFMFDKILHNELTVAPEILSRDSVRALFALRKPASTISSIVQLYRKVDPEHPYTHPDRAQAYYVERLSGLCRLAERLAGRFYYLDAEALVDEPEQVLGDLSAWLHLASPLTTEYQLFENTGKPRAGDSSDKIKSGKIAQATRPPSIEGFSPALLEQAEAVYDECRACLLRLSDTAFRLGSE